MQLSSLKHFGLFFGFLIFNTLHAAKSEERMLTAQTTQAPCKQKQLLVPRIGVGVIIIKDDKVLIGKRKNAHGEGTWAFPGGHLEFFEQIEECARREVAEETGIEVDNITFAALTNDLFETENKHYITIFMRSEYIAGIPQVKEPHKCERWEWVTWDNLPQPLFLTIQNLKKQGYTPFNQ